MVHLPFGLLDGVLVDISMVKSGLACNCVCPSCKAPLIAKTGLVRQPHFAHYNTKECKGAVETALHIAAKQIIQKEKRMMLPSVYPTKMIVQLYPPKMVDLDSVALEKRMEGLIPDITADIKKRQLLIEIAVTHSVGWEKEQKIVNKGISAIEINALDLFTNIYRSGQLFRLDEFARRLIEGVSYKRWIYNRYQWAFDDFLEQKATIKNIKLINSDPSMKFVDKCPVNKRQWKSGYEIGESYALVYEDCCSCNYCLEVEREKKYVHDGWPGINGKMIRVKCLGQFHEAIPTLLKAFKTI